MTVFDILKMIGGLALFLYGMRVMGDSLEKSQGGKMKSVLEKLTASPLKGMLLGAAVTAVMQSSSATTVMIIGFVNSGIMTFSQSTGVIIGANVGAMITNWILSLTGIQSGNFFMRLLNPESFSPILALVGILILMSKKNRKKDLGSVLIGFSVLMFGMQTMSSAVEPLKDSEAFRNLLVVFSNPVLGILVGTLVTAVIQSSSASIGILQALSTSINISYLTVVPIVLGQNIGTCITAILSSIGANKAAKRVAAFHLLYNVIGAILFIIIFVIVKPYITILSENANPFGIALVNTIFKVFGLVALFPVNKQLEKLVVKIIPDGKEDDEINLLDERFFDSPSLAVSQARTVTEKMIGYAQKALSRSLSLILDYSPDGFDEVVKAENKTDKYEDKLGTYLIKLSERDLKVSDSREVSKLLHLIGDIERIGDHALNIAEAAQEISDKKIHFSPDGEKELQTLAGAVDEIMGLASSAFINNSEQDACNIEPLEEVVDNLKATLKTNHIVRLKDGRCSIETGFVFSDIITNCERVADHCTNIGICLLQITGGSFEAHEYSVHKPEREREFDEKYTFYREKYAVENLA
ncbi:MAG: Na/Pi cotransporter family protein [Clostridia bacterium]|nr:Na/Pi cotransporter family protein [Clostridia bacterium]